MIAFTKSQTRPHMSQHFSLGRTDSSLPLHGCYLPLGIQPRVKSLWPSYTGLYSARLPTPRQSDPVCASQAGARAHVSSSLK